MLKGLAQLLQVITPFSNEEISSITACFGARSVSRNTMLLQQVQVCREFYYVHTGCVRVFFVDSKGIDKTRLVMPDCCIGTALTSFITQKPSLEQVQVLEDSEIMAIKHADFYRLMNEMPRWHEFYTRILEMAYAFQNRRIEELVTVSASERYHNLLRDNPAMVQKLSNKVLASYLDVTPETLSRIKSGAMRF